MNLFHWLGIWLIVESPAWAALCGIPKKTFGGDICVYRMVRVISYAEMAREQLSAMDGFDHILAGC